MPIKNFFLPFFIIINACIRTGMQVPGDTYMDKKIYKDALQYYRKFKG